MFVDAVNTRWIGTVEQTVRSEPILAMSHACDVETKLMEGIFVEVGTD